MTGDPKRTDEKKTGRGHEEMMGVGVALGAGIGVAFGVALQNIGMGIALGVPIGVAIGFAMMKSRQGRDDAFD